MRKILLAALVAVAATQAAPGAYAACAETHGSKAHVHSDSCGPDRCVGNCPTLPLCAILPDVHVTDEIGFECD